VNRVHELLRVRFPLASVDLPLAVLAAWDAVKESLARFMAWLPGRAEDVLLVSVALVVDVPLDEEGIELGPLVVTPKGLLHHGSRMVLALLRASETMRSWMVVSGLVTKNGIY
jgi:hypothetical protein